MRYEALETTYEVKENFTELPGVPATQQIGMTEINQLKAVTSNHASLLNTLPLIDKYVCSDETTPIVPGILYSDITSADITLQILVVNISAVAVTTNLSLSVTLGTSVFPVTILAGESLASLVFPSTEFAAMSLVRVEVLGADITVPPTGLKMKLIGTYTVVAPIP